MAEEIKHLSELGNEEYRASYDKAVILYHSHPHALDDDKVDTSGINILGQTSFRPMHPRLFYNLSQVRGFNNLNGNRYEDYYYNFINNHGNGD